MTSDEIQKSEIDPRATFYWLKEIAYQLAAIREDFQGQSQGKIMLGDGVSMGEIQSSGSPLGADSDKTVRDGVSAADFREYVRQYWPDVYRRCTANLQAWGKDHGWDENYDSAADERTTRSRSAGGVFMAGTRFAAPMVSSAGQHDFVPVSENTYCGKCGGGRLHAIHS
jgi:hypothetical protein